LGTWRAIADLSGALERETGTNLNKHSNAELEREVDAALPVIYDVESKSGGDLEEVVLKARTADS